MPHERPVMMVHELTWEDLAQQFDQISVPGEVLWAQWFACVGSENYGIWLLRPNDGATYEARTSFSLVAAKAIEKRGVLPVPIPLPEQYFAQWKLYCEIDEDMVRRLGEAIDLSEAVPHGLGTADEDAVDPCTRSWLEVLRSESPAFEMKSNGTLTMRGTEYKTVRGQIHDVARASAIFCRRLARESIQERLVQRKSPLGAAVGSGSNLPEQTAMVSVAPKSTEPRGAKKPIRRNKRDRLIDEALVSIDEGRPTTQEEVFWALQKRCSAVPQAEPFRSAGGWVAGFRKNEQAARAWLSKKWAELNLTPLPRGPKNPRK